jgi:hypothetical protein
VGAVVNLSLLGVGTAYFAVPGQYRRLTQAVDRHSLVCVPRPWTAISFLVLPPPRLGIPLIASSSSTFHSSPFSFGLFALVPRCGSHRSFTTSLLVSSLSFSTKDQSPAAFELNNPDSPPSPWIRSPNTMAPRTVPTPAGPPPVFTT